MWAPAKHKGMLRNGRDRKVSLKFEDLWTKIPVSLVIHPAWRHLTASAKDVLVIMHVKNGNAARQGKKDKTGKPKFAFPYSEAKEWLNMPSPTFSNALKDLKNKGFVGVTEYGGILCGKGKAAFYHLSGAWEKWQPPKPATGNIRKARAARKKKDDADVFLNKSPRKAR